jgi:hypothetical protein
VHFRQSLASSLHFPQFQLPKFRNFVQLKGESLSFCKTNGKQLLRMAAKKFFKLQAAAAASRQCYLKQYLAVLPTYCFQ